MASRLAVCLLSESAPDIPIYGLVDYDPDGLCILSTFKYGSVALNEQSKHHRMPNMKWLGLRNQDVAVDIKARSVNRGQGLLQLTSRDRHKAVKMLTWPRMVEDGDEPEWRRELQVMLMLNIKAEIQLLEADSGGLVKWIMDQMCEGC